MFPGANNVVITGGYFTEYAEQRDPVLTILWPHVAAGAIFDSAERYPPGRCHPGTRLIMLERIRNWTEDPNPVQRILWLYGPAGAGKSALMQASCERLRDTDLAMNGGSFFFARGHTDRGQGSKLFVTLSYQLAIQIPSVRKEITDALNRDPSLLTKSLDIQFQSLIINPLLRCQGFPSKIPTLFIDGLDECDYDQGVDTQCKIITLISNSIVEYKIPVRFMIASRPEYWIRDTFQAPPVSAITLPLTLRDDTDADKDIRSYLTDNFEKIRQEKGRIMQSVALPWPPTHIVDQFVHDASEQYVYASTILKFVGKHFSDPQEQLRIITTPGLDRVVAFSELDRLYSTILSVYPRWKTMRLVLGGLLVDVNLTVIQVILGVPKMEISLVLDALSSLIDVVLSPQPSTEAYKSISFCHLSFREFLLDHTRSRLYHVDVGTIFTEIIRVSFGTIQQSLELNYEKEPYVHYGITFSEYETMMRSILNRASSSHCEFRDLIPVFDGMVRKLQRYNPGMRMDHPRCFVQDMALLRLILGEVHTAAVDQNASPDFLQLTKRLQILVIVASDIHQRRQFLYLLGMKEKGMVWAGWAWWRVECLCVQVYLWAWYGLWHLLGMAPPWPAVGYMYYRCMVLALVLECPNPLWYGYDWVLEWSAWGYRCIPLALTLFWLWVRTLDIATQF